MFDSLEQSANRAGYRASKLDREVFAVTGDHPAINPSRLWPSRLPGGPTLVQSQL